MEPLFVVLGGIVFSSWVAEAQVPLKSNAVLPWYVHCDLTNETSCGGTGDRSLADWQVVIEDATAAANAMIQGQNGPDDIPCCASLSVGSVSILEDPSGQDLYQIDAGEMDELDQFGEAGVRAFLVDSINDCAGGVGALGCATRYDCGVTATNPDLLMNLVVTVEAHEDFDRLGATLAHERGHTVCLEHVTSTTDCQLMTSVAGGACLEDFPSLDQCELYRAAANNVDDGSCACHQSAGVAAADASACSGLPGICSGGLCGEVGSDASVRLVAAVGTAASTGDATDEWLGLSGATGGWSSSTPFSELDSGFEVRGMAYAPERNRVYAIAPFRDPSRATNGAWSTPNTLLSLNPETGEVVEMGSIGAFDEMVALAFDPGTGGDATDDRLLALALQWISGAVYCRTLVEIDPDDASAIELGKLKDSETALLVGCGSDVENKGAQGLAFDSQRSVLYSTQWNSSAPLRQIELPCTETARCLTVDVSTAESLVRLAPSLAYSATSDRLYLVGDPGMFYESSEGTVNLDRLQLDSLNAGSFETAETLTIQAVSVAGLAAVPNPFPVPEPAQGALVALGLLVALRGRSLVRGVSYSGLVRGGGVGRVSRAGERGARRSRFR